MNSVIDRHRIMLVQKTLIKFGLTKCKWLLGDCANFSTSTRHNTALFDGICGKSSSINQILKCKYSAPTEYIDSNSWTKGNLSQFVNLKPKTDCNTVNCKLVPSYDVVFQEIRDFFRAKRVDRVRICVAKVVSFLLDKH